MYVFKVNIYKSCGDLPWEVALRGPSSVKCREGASSNMSHLEAHAGSFKLRMNGIFDPYVL